MVSITSLTQLFPPASYSIVQMVSILHYLNDPRVWELWVYSLLWVMQDLYHQPYVKPYESR